MRRCIAMAIGSAWFFVAAGAHAFKLQAIGGDDPAGNIANRQARGFLQLFTSDVHERITRRAYEAAGVALPPDVMTGVRWNDNPPAIRIGPLLGGCIASDMKHREEFDCWTSMLRVDRLALETLSRREQTIPAMRSHFGDMQFLHAMAPRAAEPAAETREKILRWSQFAYRVARGEIGPRVKMHDLRSDPRTLDPATAQWLGDLFGAPEKKLWTVHDLFITGRGDLRLVAFGTFLHLVQDSYSASHVRRAATRVQANGCPSYDGTDAVIEFHTYAEQDTEKHAICDDAPDWLGEARPGSPIDVMAALVRAYHEDREWELVKPILEEQVFSLSPNARPARAGRCFERRVEPMATEGARVVPTTLEASCREEGKP